MTNRSGVLPVKWYDVLVVINDCSLVLMDLCTSDHINKVWKSAHIRTIVAQYNATHAFQVG